MAPARRPIVAIGAGVVAMVIGVLVLTSVLRGGDDDSSPQRVCELAEEAPAADRLDPSVPDQFAARLEDRSAFLAELADVVDAEDEALQGALRDALEVTRELQESIGTGDPEQLAGRIPELADLTASSADAQERLADELQERCA